MASRAQAEMTQLGFIDDRDSPGGRATYEELKTSSSISTGNQGNYCVSLMNWFSDSFLVFLLTAVHLSLNDDNLTLVMVLFFDIQKFKDLYVVGDDHTRPGLLLVNIIR